MNGRIAVTVVDHRGERHVLSLHPNTVLAQVRRMLEKLLRVPASIIRASTSLPLDTIPRVLISYFKYSLYSPNEDCSNFRRDLFQG
jgi:hypothetical protein